MAANTHLEEIGIESGIDRVNDPMAPPVQQDFGTRYLDHALEAFSGLAVTWGQLRLVELELQAQFGCRRLRPGPRSFELLAIENDKLEGQ